MRRLSNKEIEKLANRKGVRKKAVKKFLMSMIVDYSTELGKLLFDMAFYRWNFETSNAIKDGIELAMKEI